MWRSMSRAGVPAFSASMLLLGMFIEVMAQSIQGTAWNAVEVYGKAVTPLTTTAGAPGSLGWRVHHPL